MYVREKERERSTVMGENRELLRGKMPRSNFWLKVAVSYSAERLPKTDTSSITSHRPHREPHTLSHTARPLTASIPQSDLQPRPHWRPPHAPSRRETARVSTSNWENGKWSIGNSTVLRRKKSGSHPLCHRPHHCSCTLLTHNGRD